MLNLKNISLSLLLVILSFVSISESAEAMGAKSDKIPVKKEKEMIKKDHDMFMNIEDMVNRRWPDLFDTAFSSHTPRLNIKESSNSYQIEAELPGVKKEDIEVTLKDDFLVISGEKKTFSEEQKDQYRRMERSYGSFYRSVSVPRDIDRDKISAELSDGILKIEIMKTKNSQYSEKKIMLK